MKILHFVIGLISILMVVVACAHSSQKKRNDVVADSNRPTTLEAKLEELKACGLQLAPPFTIDELLKSWDRSEYEKEGFDLVLFGLGMTEEQEPWRYHSVNLWHFDTECIEDNGDYKNIAERFAEMTQGSLRLEDVKDHVDIEAGEAWLSFRFKGKQIKLDWKVRDDWVDETIFHKFAELLKEADPSKMYIYYDLEGQDCIVGCVTKKDFECLRSKGMKFTALN